MALMSAVKMLKTESFSSLHFSGLSPFLDDSDDETTSNILRCDFSFPNEHFSNVSADAKDLIKCLLNVDPASR